MKREQITPDLERIEVYDRGLVAFQMYLPDGLSRHCEICRGYQVTWQLLIGASKLLKLEGCRDCLPHVRKALKEGFKALDLGHPRAKRG